MPKKEKQEFLGEFPVDLRKSPFAKYRRKHWALLYISKYGGIDGGHHKTWVLDQVVRILNGAPVTVKEARWGNGEEVEKREYRFSVGTSERYERWVKEQRGKKDPKTGEYEYDYDEGIAP